MNTKSTQKVKKMQSSGKFNKPYSKIRVPVKKNILGIGVTDDTKENILEYIVASVVNKGKPYYIVTPNPEIIVLSTKNHEFKKVLNNARLALNDGIGVGLAGKMLGIQLHKRFTGVDVVESLCKRVADYPITVGFLGAGPKVAEVTAECLLGKYPGLRVSFVGQEWPEFRGPVARWTQNSLRSWSPTRATPPIDILFVAYGAPKQEFWIKEHVGKIPVSVMIGVGGAFDYISRKVPRAPKLIREAGFEWLFRLIVQPWRLKRQLALITFCELVIKERFNLLFRVAQ